MGIYTIGIVGESRSNSDGKSRQTIIKNDCRPGEVLILEREPKNKYDPNAVALCRVNGDQIGYIDRENAVWVSRVMDEGNKIHATLNKITGGTSGKRKRWEICRYCECSSPTLLLKGSIADPSHEPAGKSCLI